MRKEDVVAFARRDWDAIAALKRRTWAELKSRMTADETLHVGDELRNHILALQNYWPTEEDRRKDLASHVRLSEMLGRVKLPHRR